MTKPRAKRLGETGGSRELGQRERGTNLGEETFDKADSVYQVPAVSVETGVDGMLAKRGQRESNLRWPI